VQDSCRRSGNDRLLHGTHPGAGAGEAEGGCLADQAIGVRWQGDGAAVIETFIMAFRI